ncbi:unnamed protein product [Cyclocybe aegerita]|uniref:Protein kinase domain-containing protein n=1 Tax=Cyclocybe aegerita TaxID=1973307 RepID=A0A8S0VWS2_CYCAE|nr:unnamed protein product [Cyclocybe aegerita]
MEIPFESLRPITDDWEEWDAELARRRIFWDSLATKDWFRERGYTLYDREFPESQTTVPALPFEDSQEANHPYAVHALDMSFGEVPLRATDWDSGKVLFAQDSQSRHVAIKIVKDDGDEYRVLQFLQQQPHKILRSHCLIPALDMGWKCDAASFHEILDLVRAMLKGLSFLHKHNICHRDVKPANMLANHFSDDTDANFDTRMQLRLHGQLKYAMFDFDFSIMFPPTIDRALCRLPYQKSWEAAWIRPYDTSQGEFDYDPFAFDVGTLGFVLIHSFRERIRYAPLLAPLLDRMTTHRLQERFTAEQALRYLEEAYAEITEDELSKEMEPEPMPICEDSRDLWVDVPPHLAARWSSHRQPALPLRQKFLRWLCRYPTMQHLVLLARWTFYQLTTYPARFCRCYGTHSM